MTYSSYYRHSIHIHVCVSIHIQMDRDIPVGEQSARAGGACADLEARQALYTYTCMMDRDIPVGAQSARAGGACADLEARHSGSIFRHSRTAAAHLHVQYRYTDVYRYKISCDMGRKATSSVCLCLCLCLSPLTQRSRQSTCLCCQNML
jgi:hypothetical protein